MFQEYGNETVERGIVRIATVHGQRLADHGPTAMPDEMVQVRAFDRIEPFVPHHRVGGSEQVAAGVDQRAV